MCLTLLNISGVLSLPLVAEELKEILIYLKNVLLLQVTSLLVYVAFTVFAVLVLILYNGLVVIHK